MANSVLLVHSPLVGPSTWAPSAELLRSHGLDVQVPDLTTVAHTSGPMWQAFVEAAAEDAGKLSGDLAVVGHSGAGVFLPAIAEAVDDRAASLIFVDAVIPPASGVHDTPANIKALLDGQTVDGRLRPWLAWWDDQVVTGLIPDVDERSMLLAEMPSLPRSFYDESVPVPAGWMNRACAYLRLSDAYAAEYARAAEHDWRRLAIDADHLAIRTRPAEVVAAIESLLDAT
ncbi:MAG TPA: alpha/beta fold hydrolase [Nitriliruptorales bacterium]